MEIGCFFWGHNGYFKELPKAEEIFDYSKFKRLDFDERADDIITEDNSNSNFDFTL